ncbi:LEA type 2 family protein [Candidatus Nitrotoga sp. M5]|nr:LEA type 2 family protein [Candidatus Nitrotoga sp. M5]
MMMLKNCRLLIRFSLMCFFSFTLLSCATMDPNYEQPTVTLKSFRALPSEGIIPSFEIRLNILNPNAASFQLEGIVYTISIQGHEVVKGVGKDFPVIEGYSEETIKLTAAANLFAGARLVMNMMDSPSEVLEYEFEAKLDTGGFGRSTRIKEKGVFRLDGKNSIPDSKTH